MNEPQNPQLDATYHYIQLSIGIVSTSMPVLTLGIAWWLNHKYMDSISTTYYTSARNWLVASLCSLGFLFAGYQRRGRPIGAKSPEHARHYKVDSWLSALGGVFAVVVALVPTANCQNVMERSACPKMFTRQWTPEAVHGVASCFLLVVVALFCLRQFIMPTRREEPAKGLWFIRWHLFRTQKEPLTVDQKRANTVFRICGLFIVASVVLIVVLSFVDLRRTDNWKYANWVEYPPMKMRVGFIESIALWAFGAAWMTRSKFLVWKPWPAFRDPNK
jgi:hypothetical protein